MTSVLIVNLALFVPVVVGGIAMSWFGWTLAGRGGEWPVRPSGSAGPDDLARSA